MRVAVLRRPFHVVGVAARAGDLRDHHFVHLVRLFLQFPLHVHRRSGKEGVDALAPGRLDRLGATVDVLHAGAREAADHGVLGTLGDFVHGGEIAFRGDREAGLDDVDAHGVEQLGDLELLFVRHGGAGALLAVAQGRVEDDDAVLVGLGGGGHGNNSFSSNAPLGALFGVLIPKVPRVPRRETPSRPSGADKEKERAQNEGGRGFGLRRPPDRADALPRRHALEPSTSTAKLADQGKVRVNRLVDPRLLADSRRKNQAPRRDRSALLSDCR